MCDRITLIYVMNLTLYLKYNQVDNRSKVYNNVISSSYESIKQARTIIKNV